MPSFLKSPFEALPSIPAQSKQSVLGPLGERLKERLKAGQGKVFHSHEEKDGEREIVLSPEARDLKERREAIETLMLEAEKLVEAVSEPRQKIGIYFSLIRASENMSRRPDVYVDGILEVLEEALTRYTPPPFQTYKLAEDILLRLMQDRGCVGDVFERVDRFAHAWLDESWSQAIAAQRLVRKVEQGETVTDEEIEAVAKRHNGNQPILLKAYLGLANVRELQHQDPEGHLRAANTRVMSVGANDREMRQEANEAMANAYRALGRYGSIQLWLSGCESTVYEKLSDELIADRSIPLAWRQSFLESRVRGINASWNTGSEGCINALAHVASIVDADLCKHAEVELPTGLDEFLYSSQDLYTPRMLLTAAYICRVFGRDGAQRYHAEAKRRMEKIDPHEFPRVAASASIAIIAYEEHSETEISVLVQEIRSMVAQVDSPHARMQLTGGLAQALSRRAPRILAGCIPFIASTFEEVVVRNRMPIHYDRLAKVMTDAAITLYTKV